MDKAVMVVIHVTFITQEQVWHSWRGLPESLKTANSLLSISVLIHGYSALDHLPGGCHVILLRWRAGMEHLSMVSAHAGWPTHVQTPGMVVTVTRMTCMAWRQRSADWQDKASCQTTQVWRYWLRTRSKVTTHWGNWGVTEQHKHQSQDCASKLAHSAEDNSLW